MKQAISSHSSVGVVGAGRMGTPIIGHLARMGFATAACDVNPAREQHVTAVGARWVAAFERDMPHVGKVAWFAARPGPAATEIACSEIA